MPALFLRATTTRVGTLLLAAALTAACSLSDTGAAPSDSSASGEVVLVTHESFQLPKEVIADFEKESGYNLTIRPSGDAGALTNKLVLTKDSPTGDVAFGVDNTFASRAVQAGVFQAHSPNLPAGAAKYQLPGEAKGQLTPLDVSDVCVNIDDTWFADRGIKPPTTLADLTGPTYRNLVVLPGAPTSSPGMAFLLATIAEYGDGWPEYWRGLVDNGAKITAGWSDAYYVDFTQGGQDGTRPIVVSYDSSPAFTVPAGSETSTTSALLDTCFQQVEYAGVLAGAKNPGGGRALVDFLLTERAQAALPGSMYVFPVRDDVALPAAWQNHVKRPSDPYTVDPERVSQHRDEWLRTWSDIITR